MCGAANAPFGRECARYVSTAADIAAIAAPAVTALLGAYAGSRYQARAKADEELRTVLDSATVELEQLARGDRGGSQPVPRGGGRLTGDATRRVIGDHEVQTAKNAALRDQS